MCIDSLPKSVTAAIATPNWNADDATELFLFVVEHWWMILIRSCAVHAKKNLTFARLVIETATIYVI
jgi:hypothetical protein